MTQNNDLFSAYEEQAESFANFFAARIEEETLDEGKEGLSQTQILGILNNEIPEDAIIVCAAGSLPGCLHRLWRPKKENRC